MATVDNNTLEASANLSLWFKVQSGAALTLADLPEIISQRWTYFRDNWSLLRPRLVNTAANAFDPDYFRFTLDDLTDFINKQRFDTTNVNPFTSNKIYFRFYPVFNAIKLESITLTNNERAIIASKRRTVQNFSKIHFLSFKKTLREYRDYLADTVGLSDDSYNAIYGRAPIKTQSAPSLSDLNLMSVVERQLGTIDFILSNLFAVDTVIDPFALARQNANNPDINIGQYRSGKLVKLNFGEDLPGLAKRFLNNSDKWIDIAIANGLKDPYVDEIGEQLFFLTNGSGNQINLNSKNAFGVESINKFFINQTILVQSETNPFPTQRIVTGIKQIPLSDEIILTVDGESNMGSYLLSENASVRIFKPNTVNSSQYVLIPSEQQLSNTRSDEIPWFLAGKSVNEKNTKIDLAVDSTGALLLNAVGDIALSYGLDNAVQAIRAKMITELGSLRRHPEYGVVNLTGIPTAQSEEAKATLMASINKQIEADGRFDRVQSLDVTRSATTVDAVAYDVTLVVKLAGSTIFLPITFTVNT